MSRGVSIASAPATRRLVALALAALLVLAAIPNTAGARDLAKNGNAGERIETAAELRAADTKENVSIEGTGANGHVNYSSGHLNFTDGFEGETADSGVPDAWEAETQQANTAVNVTTTRANGGTQSMALTAGATEFIRVRPSSHPLNNPQTGNLSVSINPATDPTSRIARVEIREGGSRRIFVNINDVDSDNDYELVTHDDTVITDQADEDEWIDVTIFNIDPANDQYDVHFEDGAGNTGTSTNLAMESSMTAGYDELQLGTNSDNHQAFYDDVKIREDTHNKGEFISGNFTIERSDQGLLNISSVENVEIIATFQSSNNGGAWQDLGQQTFTTTGNKSINWALSNADRVRANVTFNNLSAGTASAEVFDLTVLFDARQPVVNNSSMQPRGEVQSATPEFTLDVNDSDFNSSQGDSVTAELFIDNEARGSTTLTQNGTASVTPTSALTGGNHTYNWTVTDSHGLSNTTVTRDITAPANITIRNVTENVSVDPAVHDIIDDAAAEIEIAGSNETVDKQTVTDGNISLEGLPTDERYVIIVNTSNYHQRTVLVENVFEQSTIFLLNQTFASVNQRFEVDDTTGDFNPGESRLLVQRAINRSLYDEDAKTEYQWTMVSGDRLGADQSYAVDLRRNARYRLIVKNEDNQSRVLGEHTAAETRTVTLKIENTTVDLKNTSVGVTYGATIDQTANEIVFKFNDSTDKTTNLNVTVHELGNSSNITHTSTHAGPLGDLTVTVPLTDNEADNITWVVDWNATRKGERIQGSVPLGGTSTFSLPGNIFWYQAGSAIAVGFMPFLFGGQRAELGAVVAAGIGAVAWWLNAMPTGVTGALIALALGVAAYMKYRSRREVSV